MSLYTPEQIDYHHLLAAHSELDAPIVIDGNDQNHDIQSPEQNNTASGIEADQIIKPQKLELKILNQDVRSVVEVEFKGNRRELFRNDSKFSFRCAEYVIVETDTGLDLGKVINCQLIKNREELIESHSTAKVPKHNIVRHADAEDMKKYFQNRENEPIVILRTKGFVNKHKLEMKVIDAEWQLDRKRLTIYFTAPHRIDFRNLLKDLARTFRTRIELRQLSYREETRRIGNGIGPCGLKVCCSSFLHNFCDVTLEHARTQQLTSNSTKLCGNCGKFKCCLLFEYETYAEEIEKLPPMNSIVEIPEGDATIQKIDIFKEIIYLKVKNYERLVSISFEDLNKFILQGKVFQPEIVSENIGDLICNDDINLDEIADIEKNISNDSIN